MKESLKEKTEGNKIFELKQQELNRKIDEKSMG